jgi:hypothetical protein
VGSHRAGRSARADPVRAWLTARPEPVALDRLARFAGGILTDPSLFGGGADRAEVVARLQTVAYGYLGVLEGYVHPGTRTKWSTLTVTLPCEVPTVVVDHRSALGRPGVPADVWWMPVGERRFDEEYVVTAADSTTVSRLFGQPLCEVLVRKTVQRLGYDGRRLLLRSFDGSAPTAELIDRLNDLAADVLAATPAFLTRPMGSSVPTGPPKPFPPGLYG